MTFLSTTKYSDILYEADITLTNDFVTELDLVIEFYL